MKNQHTHQGKRLRGMGLAQALIFLLVLTYAVPIWAISSVLVNTSVRVKSQLAREATPEPCAFVVQYQNGSLGRFTCTERLDTTTAAQYLAAQPDVVQVQPLRQYRATLVPNDPGYEFSRSYLDQIKAPQAWDRPMPKAPIRPVIAVLDTGVDIKNPDLKPNLWFNTLEALGDGVDNDNNGYADDLYGWDFIQNVPDPLPKYGKVWNPVAMNHGTIVAGVAAAVGNNAQGATGVAWQARIMSVRVLDSQGIGDTVTVARGIDYAVKNHADIINLSFVGPLSDPILELSISKAYQAGVLIVAAAGNESGAGVNLDRAPAYPVCDDGISGENQVIGVAAVDSADVLAGFSNYGNRCIDIAAPGTRIFSTQFLDTKHAEFSEPYGGYWSGTSVAAPLVAGALALLKAAYPSLSASNLRDVLIASGDQIDAKNRAELAHLIGNRLNIKAALELAGSARFPRKYPIVVAPQSAMPAQVTIYDYAGEALQQFTAYSLNYQRGVNLATGDIDGDGQLELITGPRRGGGPHVRTFTRQGEVRSQFMAFPEAFRGGVSITAADFSHEGSADIVVGSGVGGTNLVRFFDGSGQFKTQFMPYEASYTGGVNVAVGDLNLDGEIEIVVAPLAGGKVPVRVFDRFGRKKLEFWPFGNLFRGGVNLAVGDVDGDGYPDIVTAPISAGGPQVKVWNANAKLLSQFFAYNKAFRGGVNLAVGDVDGDGVNEVVTGPGAGGGPHVRVFNKRGEVVSQFFAGAEAFRGGISVAVLK